MRDPMAELDHDRRPGRPAPARLHRPHRRGAAPPPRARRGPVHRRGREGHPPGPAGRLPDALDAAVRQVGRRRCATSSTRRPRPSTGRARSWPSAVTGYHVHRGALASMAAQAAAGRRANCWPTARRVVVMEAVNDHTNIGAIFRSAAALGMDAVLLSPDCADPLYRRSVKVSMGAVFSVPYARLDRLAGRPGGGPRGGLPAARAHPERRRPSRSTRSPPHRMDRVALLLGAEGDGLTARGPGRRRRPGSASRWRTASTPSTSARRPPSPSTRSPPAARRSEPEDYGAAGRSTSPASSARCRSELPSESCPALARLR